VINKGKMEGEAGKLLESELWFNYEQLDSKAFQRTGVERRIKCEFLDMPFIYHYKDENFGPLFSSLAVTQNFDFFKLVSI
jgi:hypothetical protein